MNIQRAFGCSIIALLISFLPFLAFPGILEGQVPGRRIPSRERVHAEYINNIMGGIDEARAGWMAGVGDDRLDPLMAHYTADAMVIPPNGEPLYGQEAIRAYWQEILPTLGRVQTGLGDMDASGQMAMIGGTYSMERRQENGVLVRESGGLLTVFVQAGRRWFIRAQVFAAPNPG